MDPYNQPQPQQTPPPSQPMYGSPQSDFSQPPQPMQPGPQQVPQPQQYPQPQQNTWAAPQQPVSPYPQPQHAPQPHDMSYTPPPRPTVYGQTPLPIRIVEWLKSRWYVPVGILLALAVLGNIVWQVIYPMNALPPGLAVDGANVGGLERDKAVQQLDSAYSKLKVKLFFGDATVPYRTPTAAELGIQVDNSSRLATASYPLALRFVPTSYWWASKLVQVGDPVYNYDKSALDTYTLKNLGDDCVIPPRNASLKLDDDRFTVIPAEAGGKCNLTELKDAVGKTTYTDGFTVKTAIKKVEAPLTDNIAKQLGDELNNNLKNDMPLQAAGVTTDVKSAVVKGWLSFKPFIPEDKNDGTPLPPPRLLYTIEPDRVKRYLATSGVAEKVEKKPGVTKVATTDFTETSHTNGTPGVLIDITKTIASIDPFVNARGGNATVVVGQVPATVQYVRSYTPSDAGYRALIEQFAADNSGKIAIVLREISGKKPLLGGAANADLQLPAAGMEGIYLAYAAQKGIEDGGIQPTDKVYGGLSVTDCMKAAVSDQDKDCIAALLSKMGNATVRNRMNEIGLTRTNFEGAINLTTASDAATFMQKMFKNELPIKNRSNIENPLRDLSLRSGMRAAMGSSGKVAGGATDTNYNEAAIGSKNGQYVVSFVSEGAGGDKTAQKLIRAIEALRQQKQDLRN